MTTMNKGRMDIFKHQGENCSAFGLSARHENVRIWKDFDAAAPDNAVVIIEDVICNRPRIRAVPANSKNIWTMFGGCFIHTSNGIVPHHGIAIALHDRIEH